MEKNTNTYDPTPTLSSPLMQSSTTPVDGAYPLPPKVTFLKSDISGWKHSILLRIGIPVLLSIALGVHTMLMPNGDGPVDGLILGLACLFSTMLLSALSVSIWALERVFIKASVKPWKAWVPIYNLAMLYEISGVSAQWAWLELIPSPASISASMSSPALRVLGPLKLLLLPLYIISVFAAIVKIIVKLYAFTRLAQYFGKNALFGILIFLGIGLLIIGFDRSIYNPNILKDESTAPTELPTAFQLVWRGFIMFAILPLVYAISVVALAALLGVTGLTLFFFSWLLLPLVLILLPASILYLLLVSFTRALGQRFLVMNPDTIAKWCLAFTIGTGFVLYGALHNSQLTFSLTQDAATLASLILPFIIFPFAATAYFLVVTTLTQNVRLSLAVRNICLALPVLGLVGLGTLFIV